MAGSWDEKLAIARSCGIQETINYHKEDVVQRAQGADGGRSGDRDRDLRQQRCAGYGRAGAQAHGPDRGGELVQRPLCRRGDEHRSS